MAMSAWMEAVTGRTNAEHQAWRDNFNGGWAAGDFTGNINRQIASDRADAGERNPEVLANLPPDYRLNPKPVGPGAGRPSGGSVGQGVSPSRSGAGGPQVRTEPEVRKATQAFGGGALSPARVNAFGGSGGNLVPVTWSQKVISDVLKFQSGGPKRQEDAEKPMQHEQLIVNGWEWVHDKSWSTAEVAATIWGEAELLTPAWAYGWAKTAADFNATLRHNGYPDMPSIIGAAGDLVSGKLAGKIVENVVVPEWNNMVEWVNSNKAPDPVEWNPYANQPDHLRPYGW